MDVMTWLKVNDVNEQLAERVQSETGKKLRIVAGVIRNDGTGWKFIEGDGRHDKVNFSAITNDSNYITVTYNFVASRVVSLIATTDEMMASKGYLCGASVDPDLARIWISKVEQPVFSAITKSSGTFNLSGASVNVTSLSWDEANKVLNINHNDIKSYPASIVSRVPYINVSLVKSGADGGGLFSNSSRVKFFKNLNINDYVYFDGTSWLKYNNNAHISNISFSNGDLIITHTSSTGFIVDVTCKDSIYRPVVRTMDSTTTTINFYNGNTKVTTADTNMKVFFNRQSDNTIAISPADNEVDLYFNRTGGLVSNVNPNDVIEPLGNLWIIGVFEIA